MDDFKMLCLDIDGTLLNSEHQISSKTKSMTKEVVKRGILVILVSARMPAGIWFLQDELEINQAIISYNGALVIEKNSDYLLNLTIAKRDLKDIYSLARHLDVHISLYQDDHWYIENLDHWAQKESNITKTKPNIVEFEDLISVWKKGANKVLCIGEAEKVSLLEQETKNYDLDNLTIYRSKPGYLEIIPQKASKRAAIKILQKRFNVNSSEIIAIGDNYNDIDMIKYVGLGVAMGNAPQKVKEIADQVTLSNDDEGVAKAIREYILD